MSALTPAQHEANNTFLDGLIAFLIALTGALALGMLTGSTLVMGIGACVVIATGIQHLTGFLNEHVVNTP